MDAMSLLAMIRHGPTAWNGEGRLTGRSDIALAPEGRALAARYVLPEELRGAVWHVSPLHRARETAALIASAEPRVEERLIEMDFGTYEGRRLHDLRRELGDEMAANEARGLDFLPPGGESPRMVQERLKPFLREIGRSGGRHAAVAHKSVIRCIFALAYDWPMAGKEPVKLRWDCTHLFEIDHDGQPSPQRMNVPLVPSRPAGV
jgi:broad specificity phosphatase PhoE